MLITFFLCEQGILPKPLLYLSYYFKKNRLRYYEMLMNVRNHGDWEGWLKFFLRGITEVSRQAVNTAKQILTLMDQHRSMIIQRLNTTNALALYDLLLVMPIVKVRYVQDKLNVTYATANKLVGQFVDLGLLRPREDAKRDRTFVYSDYLKIHRKEPNLCDHGNRPWQEPCVFCQIIGNRTKLLNIKGDVYESERQ